MDRPGYLSSRWRSGRCWRKVERMTSDESHLHLEGGRHSLDDVALLESESRHRCADGAGSEESMVAALSESERICQAIGMVLSRRQVYACRYLEARGYRFLLALRP
jgi:hypothetical protein